MADNAVAAPLSTRNTKFQLINEYIVSRALPIRYGIVSLSGGTSPKASTHPTAIAINPATPIISDWNVTALYRNDPVINK